jgi:hypothetical protein
MSLGPLPSLGGRNKLNPLNSALSTNNNNPANAPSLGSLAFNPAISTALPRIKPSRFGLQFNLNTSSAPCLALEYFDPSGKLRYKKFHISLQRSKTSSADYEYNGEKITAKNANSIAQSIAQQLIQQNSQYLDPSLCKSSQIRILISKLLSKITENSSKLPSDSRNRAKPSDNSATINIPSNSPGLKAVDLSRADDSTLNAAKAAMSLDFNANLLKPGDMGYVYDKRVEFEEGTEPSEWD